MSPTWSVAWNWLLLKWMALRSRKLSTPPMILPWRSRKGEALIERGIRFPSRLTMWMDLLDRCRSCSMQAFKAQAPSHMEDWKTSRHLRPMASAAGIPVMAVAARLKKVTVQSRSTVKTPSARLSMIASQGMFWGRAMGHPLGVGSPRGGRARAARRLSPERTTRYSAGADTV